MERRHRLSPLLAAVLGAALVAACSAPSDAIDASPPATGSPSPSTSAPPTTEQRVAQLAVPGPYVTKAVEYDLAPVRLPGAKADSDVVAQVVGPVEAEGALPVVMLLHGFWPSCYLPDGEGSSNEWPCPTGWKPIPSHRGFTYLQERLASHGYLTVSVSANAVNVQNEEVGRDAGARARAALLRHHLDVLAAGGVPELAPWPQVDLSRVLLVGHSRGGEGVDRAAYEQPDDADWSVAGAVLVGATAFDPVPRSRAAVIGMTGDCDGDVGPGIGQLYVDRDATGPQLLRSSVLIGGANHNFFNTEWDAATSESGGGGDDVVGDGQDPGPRCAPGSASRLSPSEQQESLARGVTFAAAAVLSADDAATAVLDGRAPWPTPDGQRVWVTATGAGRTTLLPGQGFTATGRSPASARVCTGQSSEEDNPQLCGGGSVQGLTVHWPDVRSPWKAHDAVEVRWTAPGGAVRLDLAAPLDLSSSSALEMRVPVDDVGSPVTLEVSVVDSGGATAELGAWGPVEAMPGDDMLPSRRWAQPLLLPLDDVAGVDLSQVVAVVVTPRSASGRVWLLDVSAVPA